MTEQFSNFGFSYLTAAINSSVTTITVDSGTPFPGSSPYRITVDAEIMVVTGGAGSASWTVTRGQEGTTAASHAEGAIVAQTLTKTGLSNTINDHINTYQSVTGTTAALPAAGTSGRLYFPTDGCAIFRDNGTAWSTFGPAFAFTPPNITGWTWINQDVYGNVSAYNDSVYFYDTGGQGTNDVFRCLVNTIPTPTAAWTYIAAFAPNMYPQGTGAWGGITISCSTSNQALNWIAQYSSTDQSNFNVYTGTIPGGSSGGSPLYTSNTKGGAPLVMFKITNDTTNLNFYVSRDFRHWQLRETTTVSSQFSSPPDSYGFVLNNFNTSAGNESGLTFYHAQLTQ